MLKLAGLCIVFTRKRLHEEYVPWLHATGGILFALDGESPDLRVEVLVSCCCRLWRSRVGVASDDWRNAGKPRDTVIPPTRTILSHKHLVR